MIGFLGRTGAEEALALSTILALGEEIPWEIAASSRFCKRYRYNDSLMVLLTLCISELSLLGWR